MLDVHDGGVPFGSLVYEPHLGRETGKLPTDSPPGGRPEEMLGEQRRVAARGG